LLTTPPANKRNARDSFITKSTYLADPNDGKSHVHFHVDAPQSLTCLQDDELDLHPSKKIRISERQANLTHISRCVSIISISSDGSNSSSIQEITAEEYAQATNQEITAEESAQATNTSTTPPPTRTTATLTSYPGQFTSYETKYLNRHKKIRSTEPKPNTPLPSHRFGDRLHANGLITHTAFIPDPQPTELNYTSTSHLYSNPLRGTAWEHAHNMSIRAGKMLTRTPSEEQLRREIHLECASARLEGCSVGQYRYYQGHMSVEEYVAANMCVCWEECWCSKLCTRFGDVLCPCAGDVVLAE
jgi:hypothetical protein